MVQDLLNIEREEGHIFYMRKFKADAVIDLPTSTVTTPIEFSIETTPFGSRLIKVKLIESINYPVLPLRKALIEFIDNADLSGKIPQS